MFYLHKLSFTSSFSSSSSLPPFLLFLLIPHFISVDPSSSKLDHFSHLRRQWASKAQNFRANLNNLETGINTDSVEMAFHDLLQGHKSFRRRSITPTALEGGRYQRKKRQEGPEEGTHEVTQEVIVRSYSDEDLGPPLGPAPPPPEMEDEEETLVEIA